MRIRQSERSAIKIGKKRCGVYLCLALRHSAPDAANWIFHGPKGGPSQQRCGAPPGLPLVRVVVAGR